jgi:hypothetical protein
MPSRQLPSSVKFHYVKSNLFRVIHTEGVVGGLTPNREIFVALFNQRAALPKIIEFALTPEGQLGNEITREGKEGIVREMEIGISLSEAGAQELATFLLQHVKLLRESEPAKQDESISIGKEPE